MLLSIAINNFKNPELLRLCLESVRRNVKGVEYELIVADSMTDEQTSLMMREDYPDVQFFPFKENVGFQRLVKQGIEASKGKYILLLNGDILVSAGSVEKLVTFLQQHPDVGMVGPKLLNFNGTLQYSCFRYYKPITIVFRRTFLRHLASAKRHLDWFLMKEYDHQEPQEVDWLMGSSLLVSREAVKKVGLMDPQFFLYMEDVDWCRRFWESGYKVVHYPGAEMHHYHGKASGKSGFLRSLFSNRLTWTHIASAIKYFWKYRGKSVPQHT